MLVIKGDIQIFQVELNPGILVLLYNSKKVADRVTSL